MNPTTIQSATRINSHGKVTALPFTLGKQVPVSLFFAPIGTNVKEFQLVDVKLSQDSAASACPFGISCWTEPSVEILTNAAANSTLLAEYNIYWGAGTSTTYNSEYN